MHEMLQNYLMELLHYSLRYKYFPLTFSSHKKVKKLIMKVSHLISHFQLMNKCHI